MSGDPDPTCSLRGVRLAEAVAAVREDPAMRMTVFPTLAGLMVGLCACGTLSVASQRSPGSSIEGPATPEPRAAAIHAGPGAALGVGPGPMAVYTVQSQPPPGTCHYTYIGRDPLPDPRCTPGAVSPQVTQDDIGSTICRSGYAGSVRPPESVTDAEKIASAAAYGYTGSFRIAEYDHLVPLELGGDPNDPANLWVEPNDLPGATSTANGKDLLEGRLNHLVCSGRVPLATAQQAIATDWVSAIRRYGG